MNQSTFTKEYNYKLDTFVRMYDIQAEDSKDLVELQELIKKINKTPTEISRQNELKNKFNSKGNMVSADQFNYFCDCLYNMEKFLKDEVEGYILTKQQEIQSYCDSTKATINNYSTSTLSTIDQKKTDILQLMTQKENQLADLDSRTKFYVQQWTATQDGQIEYDVFINGLDTTLQAQNATLPPRIEMIECSINGSPQSALTDFGIKPDGLYRTIILKGNAINKIKMGTIVYIRYCKNLYKPAYDHGSTHLKGGGDEIIFGLNNLTTEAQTIINNKINNNMISSAINSISTTNVANSYAVKQAYDKGVSAYGLANAKQDFTVIASKLPTDLPSTYPLGYSTFYITDTSWKTSCGVSTLLSAYAVLETCHAKLNYGITQKITWFNGSHNIQAIFERASCSQSSWGTWVRILDNTTTMTELNTTNKTITGAINEVFQLGNNVKSNMVNTLLQVDNSLPITTNSKWNDIISNTANINIGTKYQTQLYDFIDGDYGYFVVTTSDYDKLVKQHLKTGVVTIIFQSGVKESNQLGIHALTTTSMYYIPYNTVGKIGIINKDSPNTVRIQQLTDIHIYYAYMKNDIWYIIEKYDSVAVGRFKIINGSTSLYSEDVANVYLTQIVNTDKYIYLYRYSGQNNMFTKRISKIDYTVSQLGGENLLANAIYLLEAQK